MNGPLSRTIGALSVAVVLATSSSTAVAATRHRVETLSGLSRELASSAIQASRSLKGSGGTSQAAPLNDTELDLNCNGDWFITWEEDAQGNAIVGTYNLHWAGTVVKIG